MVNVFLSIGLKIEVLTSKEKVITDRQVFFLVPRVEPFALKEVIQPHVPVTGLTTKSQVNLTAFKR